MTPFLTRYLDAWVAFCLIAAVIALRDLVAAKNLRASVDDAAAFLRVPWKLALFTPAMVFVTFAGGFTDDETWDVVSGGGMSILTFATSWWAVGTIVRVFRRQRPARELVVALAVMFFSSSWSYDGYLLLRDGAYTSRWLGNLLLSPIVYACAGIVLNLEIREDHIALAFSRADWPRPRGSSKASWAIALVSLPLVALAAYILVGAVGWHSPFGR